MNYSFHSETLFAKTKGYHEVLKGTKPHSNLHIAGPTQFDNMTAHGTISLVMAREFGEYSFFCFLCRI